MHACAHRDAPTATERRLEVSSCVTGSKETAVVYITGKLLQLAAKDFYYLRPKKLISNLEHII